MHFKNGREAKTGDHVIAKSYNGNLVAGVIFDLHADGGNCNCNLAMLKPGGTETEKCHDVGTMIHVEDAAASADAYERLRDDCQKQGWDTTATDERVA